MGSVPDVIIDISPPVGPDTPVWPGDVAYRRSTHWPMTDGSPVEVSHITTTAHLGAHADAPAHFVAGGEPIGSVALEPYLGPCRVIHCLSDDPRALIGLAEVRAALGDREPVPRLLIRSYRVRPKVWDPDLPGLDPDLVTWLGAEGVRLIGVDTASFDPTASKDLPAHRAAYAHGIAILEGLVLGHVDPGDYELIALPLRLSDLDASPVRAVLRELA